MYGYYGGMGYYNLNYLIYMLPAILITMFASYKVKSTFSKYSRIENYRRMTGYECARRILDAQGLTDVQIARISGSLTDHYDPRSKIVRLSDTVFSSDSISAISVAAHECGHAVQHQKGYVPLVLRNTMVPVVNFTSSISWILILLGFVLNALNFVYIGIICFSFAVLFQLLTLPVEFNASSRALTIMETMSIVDASEKKGAKKVLSAAALTYVAAALTSIMQLLRLVAMVSGDRR